MNHMGQKDRMKYMKKILIICLALWVLLAAAGCSRAAEPVPTAAQPTFPAEETQPMTEPVPETTVPETIPEEPEPVAEYIAEGVAVMLDGRDITGKLSDDAYYTMHSIKSTQSLTVESEVPFGALYIKWETHPGPFSLTWEDGSMDCGAEGFLHDYIRLPEEVTSVAFTFAEESSCSVCEMGAYTAGTAPEGVQDWQAPCEQADILVFPTHSDDDVLFFGAVMSYYAVEAELTVQTAFMAEHWYEPVRNHERLDGLWTLGIRHYPILGTAWDYFSRSLEETKIYHRNDPILDWQVEQIRRFQPLVILGHDLEGEYGHGQHRLNAYFLVQAVEAAADPAQFPESAQNYGTWDAPKLYLHLYEENGIVFDVNTPLEKDPAGRTPFEIAEDAYQCHRSQLQYYFKVTQDENSPLDCSRFGLYRTLVGYDTGADLMENVDADAWRQ